MVPLCSLYTRISRIRSFTISQYCYLAIYRNAYYHITLMLFSGRPVPRESGPCHDGHARDGLPGRVLREGEGSPSARLALRYSRPPPGNAIWPDHGSFSDSARRMNINSGTSGQSRTIMATAASRIPSCERTGQPEQIRPSTASIPGTLHQPHGRGRPSLFSPPREPRPGSFIRCNDRGAGTALPSGMPRHAGSMRRERLRQGRDIGAGTMSLFLITPILS